MEHREEFGYVGKLLRIDLSSEDVTLKSWSTDEQTQFSRLHFVARVRRETLYKGESSSILILRRPTVLISLARLSKTYILTLHKIRRWPEIARNAAPPNTNGDSEWRI